MARASTDGALPIKRTIAAVGSKLSLCEEFARGHVHGSGKPDNRNNSRILAATLDAAEVRAIHC